MYSGTSPLEITTGKMHRKWKFTMLLTSFMIQNLIYLFFPLMKISFFLLQKGNRGIPIIEIHK